MSASKEFHDRVADPNSPVSLSDDPRFADLPDQGDVRASNTEPEPEPESAA